MAKKTLVVVESPAKAKTINKYLGTNYKVEASVGHIKDLVSTRLGVDVEKDFVPTYVTIKGKADVIKKIKSAAKESETVLIATDPDREGEAIAFHLAEEIKQTNTNIRRVLFNEITKAGIKKGLAEPRSIDMDLFMSQQARRVMDRLIGFQVSPFLSRAMLTKTTQILSAGRVQSVALRLICERDEEITNFKPIDYWSIMGSFKTEDNFMLKAKLVEFDGDKIKNPDGSGVSTDPDEQAEINKKLAQSNYIKSEKQAEELIARIKKEQYNIGDITKKQIRRNPLPPFTTSTLQQEASRRLGFSNKKTMSLAQRLYEGENLGSEGLVGLITYMRTDSVRISPEAQQAAREHIENVYGNDYVPDKIPQYTSKSANVQDAHEAIRPTTISLTPSKVRQFIDKDLANLYEIIYNRFLSSQMAPAIIDQTTVNITGGTFVFRVTGSVIVFKGFLAAFEDIADDNEEADESKLPDTLKEKQKLDLKKAESVKSQTKPPYRYTEATLVKELDEKGIGRPSTYATIVSTLLDRNYVELTKKTFFPTELGKDVNIILVKHFPELFNVDFTRDMEDELDTVADGKNTYTKVLTSFYNPFSKSLEKAEKTDEIEQILCENCGSPMVIKVSRRGRFLACSKYPDCKFTKPLPKSSNEPKQEPVIAKGIFCDLCGKEMYIRESKFGKFYGCVDYPTCKGIKPISSNVKCPKCGEGELAERFSPKSRKKFWGCSNYPKCDYLTNYEPLPKKCSNCGNDYIEVHFKKSGDGWDKFIQCPKCKEKFDFDTLAKIE